jgi:hypothetical protein
LTFPPALWVTTTIAIANYTGSIALDVQEVNKLLISQFLWLQENLPCSAEGVAERFWWLFQSFLRHPQELGRHVHDQSQPPSILDRGKIGQLLFVER